MSIVSDKFLSCGEHVGDLSESFFLILIKYFRREGVSSFSLDFPPVFQNLFLKFFFYLVEKKGIVALSIPLAIDFVFALLNY